MGRLNAQVVFTDRADGDFRPLPAPSCLDDVSRESDFVAALIERRRAITATPWTWLRQVHGARVVSVGGPGEMAGAEADGAVTAALRTPLAIATADCAPVVLVAERGVAVLHAGWRSLVAGVIGNAASQLRASSGEPVASFVGPCINPSAYEFGGDDLALVKQVLGAAVAGTTAWGTPALDVPAAVRAALSGSGWPPPSAQPPCTSHDKWFSYRTRADVGRQVTVAWIEDQASEVRHS